MKLRLRWFRELFCEYTDPDLYADFLIATAEQGIGGTWHRTIHFCQTFGQPVPAAPLQSDFAELSVLRFVQVSALRTIYSDLRYDEAAIIISRAYLRCYKDHL